MVKQELALSKADINTVLMLLQLTDISFRPNPPIALTYGQKGSALAEQLGYQKGEARCLQNIAGIYYFQGRYPAIVQKEYIKYFLRALPIVELECVTNEKNTFFSML